MTATLPQPQRYISVKEGAIMRIEIDCLDRLRALESAPLDQAQAEETVENLVIDKKF